MSRTKEDLEKALKEATSDLKHVLRRKASGTYKQLSKYSQGLLQQEHNEAVTKQFDIIEEIVNLNLPEQEAIAIVTKATK